MRTLQFSSEDLRSFFFDHTIGTMEQLKDVLGTSVDMTIYRKLRQLSYLTSYSHHGKYYTLEELTDFDSFGLWQFDVAHFSKYGTLLKTAQMLIEQSDKGYSVSELRVRLGVDVKEALLQLYKEHRVNREEIAGRYVMAADGARSAVRRSLGSSTAPAALGRTTASEHCRRPPCACTRSKRCNNPLLQCIGRTATPLVRRSGITAFRTWRRQYDFHPFQH